MGQEFEQSNLLSSVSKRESFIGDLRLLFLKHLFRRFDK